MFGILAVNKRVGTTSRVYRSKFDLLRPFLGVLWRTAGWRSSLDQVWTGLFSGDLIGFMPHLSLVRSQSSFNTEFDQRTQTTVTRKSSNDSGMVAVELHDSSLWTNKQKLKPRKLRLVGRMCFVQSLVKDFSQHSTDEQRPAISSASMSMLFIHSMKRYILVLPFHMCLFKWGSRFWLKVGVDWHES